MQFFRLSLLIGLCALISCEEKRMMGNALAQFLGQCQRAAKTELSSVSVGNFAHDGAISRNGDIQLRNVYVDGLDTVEISSDPSKEMLDGGYWIGFKANHLTIRGYVVELQRGGVTKNMAQLTFKNLEWYCYLKPLMEARETNELCIMQVNGSPRLVNDETIMNNDHSTLNRMSSQIASKLANQIMAVFREIISEKVAIEIHNAMMRPDGR